MATKGPKLKILPFGPHGELLSLGKRWERWLERFERDLKYNGDAENSETAQMALLIYAPLFTALIMICKVKLWYIILINGYLCNRTRGLRRRKAINAKSGKKRLILAQLHRSCVSLRTVFELPSYDPVEFSLT